MFYNIDRGFKDPRVFRRFGNVTTTSTSEILVSSRAYVEQSSQAQRSVKSTSTQDSDSAGTGARVVRITYLDSSYAVKTEDVALNGTTRVSTVATDIRFIEKFEVIKGTEAVGAIQLLDAPSGAQNEFCGIASATTVAFLCHHYVPAGMNCWILHWGSTVDDDSSLKLTGQARPDGTNLVNRILDLEKVFGASVVPDHLFFDRDLAAVLVPEKTYVRITVAPGQSTSTTIRSWFYFWEEAQ